MGQLLRQIFGDQPDAEARCGFAMQPYGGASSLEWLHLLREETAGSGGGEPRRRIAVHRGTAIGRGDDRVGSLEQDNASCELSGAPCRIQPGRHPAEQTRKEPLELRFMRCENRARAKLSEQA